MSAGAELGTRDEVEIERLRRQHGLLLDVIAEAVVTAGPDLVVDGWNAGAVALYGWSAAEAIGRPLSSLAPCGGLDADGRALPELATAGHWSGAAVHRHKDGREIQVHSTVTVTADADRRPIEVMVVSRPAGSAQEGFDRCQTIFETANTAIVISTPDGRFIDGNSPFLEAAGRTRAELEELGIDVIYPKPGNRAKFLEVLRQRGQIRDRETQLVSKTGELNWWSISSKLTCEGGEERILSIAVDIDRRKRSEEALLASERRLRTMMEQSPVAVEVFSPEGRIVEVNEATFSLWGFSQEVFPELAERYNVLEDEQLAQLGLRPFIERAYAGESGMLPPALYDPRKTMEDLGFERVEGRARWIQGRVYPLIGDGGEIQNVVLELEDLTERKTAEDALWESELRFRSLFERAADAIGMSVDGVIAAANPAYVRLFGYSSAAEAIGKPILDHVAPEERQRIIQYSHRRERGGPAPALYETVGLRTDGTTFDMEVRVGTYEVDGTVQTIAIIRDITERKRAALALQQSEERLRAVVEALPDVVFVLDEDGRYVEVLTTETGRLAKGASEMKGRLLHEVLETEVADAFLDLLQDTIESGRSQMVEYELDVLDGHRLFEGRSAAVDLRFDGKRAAVLVTRDVTERRRTEQELIESEARYRTLFEQSNDGILIADVDSRRLLFANPSACRLFGYEQHELVDLCIADLHPDHALDDIEIALERQQRNEPSLMQELPCLRKDGRVVFADVSASSITLDGKLCAVACFRDVTERRLLSELKRKTAELEAFNEAMIGRESRVIELKEEVNWLSCELGREPPYDVVWEAKGRGHDEPHDRRPETLPPDRM